MSDSDQIFNFNLNHNGVRTFQRLHRTIERQIGISIVSGEVKPGDVLPGEIVSSVKFDVSRSVYREVLRTLATKGMVESSPKVGTRVTNRNRWTLLDPDVLEWSFSNRNPDQNFVRSLFELRMIIEPEAAALAALRRTDAHVERLHDAWLVMSAETLASERGRIADREFHHGILEASGNEVLNNLSSGIGAAVLWTTILKYKDKPLPRDPVKDHFYVFEAIRNADPEAARAAMQGLVKLALRDIYEIPT